MDKIMDFPISKENFFTQHMDIFEHLPAYIYCKNKESKYLWCNLNLAKLAGLETTAEIVGKTDKELPWSDWPSLDFVEMDQEVIRTGQKNVRVSKLPIKNKNGDYLYIKTEKTPFKGQNGKTQGILGIAIDITDQKKIVAQLTKEKEDAFHNLEYIVSNMPGYIYWKNKNSQYMGCNNNLAKFSHLKSPADIVGKTDYDFEWGTEQADQFVKDDKEIMATGKTLTTEYELSTKKEDGSYLYVRTDKMPFYNKEGKVIGVLAIAVDITEQKILEKNVIEERDKAQIANKIKTEFIRNIEHDIRTPFSGIWGMANILWEKESDPLKKEWLGDISQCAKELLNYCNEVLDFSKIEANELPLVEKKFSLSEIFLEVVKMETPPAKMRDLTLESIYDKNLPEIILGDKYRLYRILINLVSNAVKFTHTGKVSIEFKLAKQSAKKVVVQFIVIDTGIGMPEERQSYIYEKFTKLSPSNQGVYKGVGIGLTIVKRFVDEMEGEIEVDSKVGIGSKFMCTIPFKLPLI